MNAWLGPINVVGYNQKCSIPYSDNLTPIYENSNPLLPKNDVVSFLWPS